MEPRLTMPCLSILVLTYKISTKDVCTKLALIRLVIWRASLCEIFPKSRFRCIFHILRLSMNPKHKFSNVSFFEYLRLFYYYFKVLFPVYTCNLTHIIWLNFYLTKKKSYNHRKWNYNCLSRCTINTRLSAKVSYVFLTMQLSFFHISM